ncbi:MAG: class I SAM-dependent methyltransferase [Burkholderiales bacterium]
MNPADSTLVALSRPRARPGFLAGIARRIVHARLADLRHGRLVLHEPGGEFAFGDPTGGAEVRITIIDPAFYAELAFGGSVGASESFMLGHWKTNDLTALVRLLIRNRAALDELEGGLALVSAPLRLAAHWLHRNTRAGSRRNISAHYDLGNDFFRLFLDETLMYSCALFERPEMTLAEASIAKLEAVCRKLQLGPNDHVLEIGSGWGGFALHAASRYGCRVTTTTISPSQHFLAIQRIRAAGLQDRVTVLRKDYRELTGSYDKLVSIEMIEAVGHQYYDDFFRICAERLAPGGKMLLQAITIAEQRFEQARREVDFIKRYIFPGCCIPSVSILANAAAASGKLDIVALENIGPHYATTLAQWRRNFLANLDGVRALGLPDSFIRMWEFYFCYCEAGFAERALHDVQILLERTS